jgi:hypothetical protein
MNDVSHQVVLLNKKSGYFVLLIALLTTSISISTIQKINAQIVYGFTISNGTLAITRVDLSDCSWCQVFEVPALFEFAIHPNGSIITTSLGNFGMNVYTPPSTTPVANINLPGINELGIAISPSGVVYVTTAVVYGSGTGSLYTYDIATNTLNYVGDFPPNIQLEDLYFWNGALYGITPYSGNAVYQINTTNPSASVQTSSIISNPVVGMEGIPGLGIIVASNMPYNGLSLYDPVTGGITNYCMLSPLVSIRSLSSWPPGTPELTCLCPSDAGTIANVAPNICTQSSVSIPFPNGTHLDPDDALQFILFTNPNAPLTTIVATSDLPNFVYNASTMQTGVQYCIAAIVGDSLPNGQVDLNDPCLDISNMSCFNWRPQPTVSFSASNTMLCQGTCQTIEVQLTGSPPFSLNYTTPFGSFVQSFAGTTGMIEVCAPLGASLGLVQLVATALGDFYCVCD